MIPKLMFALLAAVTVLLSLSADQGKSFLSSIVEKPFRRKVTLLVVKQILSGCKRSVLNQGILVY